MTRHLAKVHVEKKAYNCPLCEKEFAIKNLLNHHIAKVHEEIQADKCWRCTKEFSQKDGLEKQFSQPATKYF